ncbi:MAG: ATPase domain-containing protein, partial [Candidatus Altiarchaeota archaeon]|nr:ATPase domain-containing protein [Candidatus Altiarchaeota archaeon]
RIVFDCLGAGKRVLYLSTHTSREDVIAEMSSYSFFDPKLADSENMRIEGYFNNLPEVADMAVEFDVCIIDPFSALIMNKDKGYVVDFLGTLKKLSRKRDMRFFLSMDHGISEERTENIVRSMVDGIIHFKEMVVGRRIERYVYVPKLKGRIPMGEMTPIIVTEKGIVVDTRQTIR